MLQTEFGDDVMNAKRKKTLRGEEVYSMSVAKRLIVDRASDMSDVNIITFSGCDKWQDTEGSIGTKVANRCT